MHSVHCREQYLRRARFRTGDFAHKPCQPSLQVVQVQSLEGRQVQASIRGITGRCCMVVKQLIVRAVKSGA